MLIALALAALPHLIAPSGFRVEVVSSAIPAARFMAFAPNGDLLVSQTRLSHVVAVRPDMAPAQTPAIVLKGLALPHGLAFRGDELYAAVWSGVIRLRYPRRGGVAPLTLIDDMPMRDDHNFRALALSSAGSIFVSSGSSCNVCIEHDARLATVLRYPADAGGGGAVFSSGLRNASGLAFDGAGRLWATVNGRDGIGDDLPPDELDRVVRGADYGWPYCYAGPAGSVRVANPEFAATSRCRDAAPSTFDLPAHAAPLGIAFYGGTQFPAHYRGAAFIALHGSSARSTPSGYKVVAVFFRDGRPTTVEDFVTGFLDGAGAAVGRPAGIAVGPDGALYISDDKAGAVYRVRYIAHHRTAHSERNL